MALFSAITAGAGLFSGAKEVVSKIGGTNGLFKTGPSDRWKRITALVKQNPSLSRQQAGAIIDSQGGTTKNKAMSLFDNIGGNVRLGKDTNTGLVPIVIAIAAAVAIAFGGGLIRFGRKKRRR